MNSTWFNPSSLLVVAGAIFAFFVFVGGLAAEPRDGTIIDRFDNGRPMWIRRYHRGKLHGEISQWHYNGRLLSRLAYENGRIKDGVYRRYYANGALMTETTYREGKRNGPARELHADGSMYSEGRYTDDLKIGLWKYSDRDGSSRHEFYGISLEHTLMPAAAAMLIPLLYYFVFRLRPGALRPLIRVAPLLFLVAMLLSWFFARADTPFVLRRYLFFALNTSAILLGIMALLDLRPKAGSKTESPGRRLGALLTLLLLGAYAILLWLASILAGAAPGLIG